MDLIEQLGDNFHSLNKIDGFYNLTIIPPGAVKRENGFIDGQIGLSDTNLERLLERAIKKITCDTCGALGARERVVWAGMDNKLVKYCEKHK